jgi:hypothetical protein
MVVHSDSELGFLLTFLLTCAVLIALFTSAGLAMSRKFRSAAKLAGITLGAMAAWVLVVSAISFAMPQTIVKIGDTYCLDIRCTGIDEVSAESKGSDTIYKLDIHVFSDANTVKVAFIPTSLALVDERGRQFPLMPAGDTAPSATYLEPQQTIKTTLLFAAPSDARQLFLLDPPRRPGDNTPGSIGVNQPPRFLRFAALWFYLATLGNDAALLHKPTMLRVL